MSQIVFNRFYENVIIYIFFIFLFGNLSFNFATIIQEINQAVFLDPKTNTAIIRCPLDFIHGLEIQWYDVNKQQYEFGRGRYFRINGSQGFDRELICSSVSQIEEHGKDEKYRIKVRLYDRPLPIQYLFISNASTTHLTVQWNDDKHNRNANITNYELILKYNNTIHNRISVSNIASSYTFSALHPNTIYSIDISAIDIWKRSSKSTTITGRTLPLNSTEKISSHKIISSHSLYQTISCYRLNHQFLLIEFNRSKLLILNYIYNFTIYDNQDHIILIDNLYSPHSQLSIIKTLNSFIYQIQQPSLKFKIKVIVSTTQSNYLGSVSKYCEDFYPVYSPLTCTIKSIGSNRYDLMIHTQLFDNAKDLITLKPNYVFYQTSQSYVVRKKIYDIRKYTTATITDVKDNYSIIVENNLLGSDTNDKLNISILCSIISAASTSGDDRIFNTIVIGLILFVVCLIIFIYFTGYQKGLILNCRRITHNYTYLFPKPHRSRSSLIQLNGNHLSTNYEEIDSIPIPIHQFGSHVLEMHRDNNLGFLRLFEDICESSKTHRFPSEISQMEFNQSKNRYIDILTYDHSRVKLFSIEKDGRENYINANYVDGYEKTNAYIATQGPMMSTMKDFWKMIWEENVNVIGMITNVEENGRVKCDVYWPQEGTEMYGNIQVTLTSVTSLAYYAKRIFTIRCKTNGKFTDEERLVYQFHYTDWPDHGVPLLTLPVLSFIRHSSSCNAKSDGPIVVHCSAGVGRTGTYIVIDSMLKQLREQDSLNIPSFLKRIRQQRNFLVQTEEQFIFIYDVLLEAINLLMIGSQDVEMNKQNFDSILSTLDHYDQDSNLTQIEKQFQLIQTHIDDFQVTVGQMRENSKKNRTQAVLPLDSYRVSLPTNGGYINASYIHGYHRVDEFIITQHPMQHTRIDFWQMIWNTKANIIVSLYADETSQSDVPDFWPLLNQMIDCGDFNVYITDEQFECDYIYRDFILKSSRKGNLELRVKQISTSYWPETCSPMKTCFDLINNIKTRNPSTPIIVHDLFGGHRAATFCALYTMNERMQAEGTLNVYELAKVYCTKRPGIWHHSGDILFLYRCAEILFHE